MSLRSLALLQTGDWLLGGNAQGLETLGFTRVSLSHAPSDLPMAVGEASSPLSLTSTCVAVHSYQQHLTAQA